MKRWSSWLGIAWIVFSAIYFYTHFAYVFYDANREAIRTLLANVFG